MTKDILSDVVRLMKEGVSTRKAADELGIHQSKIMRLKKKAEQDGLL